MLNELCSFHSYRRDADELKKKRKEATKEFCVSGDDGVTSRRCNAPSLRVCNLDIVYDHHHHRRRQRRRVSVRTHSSNQYRDNRQSIAFKLMDRSILSSRLLSPITSSSLFITFGVYFVCCVSHMHCIHLIPSCVMAFVKRVGLFPFLHFYTIACQRTQCSMIV